MRPTRNRDNFMIIGIIVVVIVVIVVVAIILLAKFATDEKRINQENKSVSADDISNPFAFVISKTKEAMGKDAEQYLEQGDKESDPDKAIAAYEMAIKLKPDLDMGYINMGLTYAEKKQNLKKALLCYEKALSINPNSNDAYFNRGCAYARLKEFDKAIESYKEAVKCNQYDFDSYWYMGCCYRDKGDEEKQIECVKIAAELGDEKAKSWLMEEKGFVSVSVKNKTKEEPRVDTTVLLNQMLKEAEEKQRACGGHHDWEMSHEDGRFYCTKCGADGGSPWDC